MARRERPLLLIAEAADGRPLRRSLETYYEVVSARTASEAIELARELTPDLLIAEGDIPEGGGLAVAMRWADSPLTDTVPVIVLAEPYDDADAVRCLDLGVADYLARTIGLRELTARIEKAMRDSRQRRELAELARTDALTGLANYRALMLRLEEEFSRASRYDYPMAIVMIDLDNLKQINDRFGHDVGNRAIVALTQTLKATMRQVDFAARYGGDEFVVLLPHQTPQEASILLERIRRVLASAQLTSAEGKALDGVLTLSAGVAGHTAEDPRHSPEGLMQLADAALYQAKRGGRDRVVVCDRRNGPPAHTQA